VAAPAGMSLTLTRADYEACQARDEQGFKAAIEAISLKALQQGLATVDYQASVREQWRRLGIDDIIDQRVDAAIGEVRYETSWGQLLQSLAYQEKAKELATTVAERVYRSDAMKTAIESLAVGVSREIDKVIELATVDAAEPATQCIHAFLRPRFGSTIAKVVATDAAQAFKIDPEKGSADVSRGSILLQGREGIAGAVILLVRRQLSNMATRVGQRLVGAVLSRLVSVVAGGVGVVLLAKDLWDLRNGVLPIISEEMKSKATKQRVQEELATTIGEQLQEQTREIAAKTAERVTEIWQQHRSAHSKMLGLAEQNEAFKTFLGQVAPERLPQGDEVVSLIVAREGDAGVLRRLGDGTLYAAVNTLEQPGMEIARETKSIDTALQWAALAGDRLPRLVEDEIHKRASPDKFTKSSLSRLLSLDDRLASIRLASIKRDARDVLFELDNARLSKIARALSETELNSLASYLRALPGSVSARILGVVSQNPARMQVLASDRVREAVLASRDPNAAVGMLLRADPWPSWLAWLLAPQQFLDDAQLVLDGRVSPVLLWAQYPVVIVLSGVLTLVLLLLMKRLVFGRRRRSTA
jgi:hypothetical protein